MSDARLPEGAKAPLGGQRGTHSDKRGSPMTAAPTLIRRLAQGRVVSGVLA